MADTTKTAGEQEPWFLRSAFPCRFPSHPAFRMTDDEFAAFLRKDIKQRGGEQDAADGGAQTDDADTFTMVSTPPSTAADVREKVQQLDISDDASGKDAGSAKHPFIEGLRAHGQAHDVSNKMLTENADVAYRSTTNPLVDLFSELEEVVSGPRLLELLNTAWAHDSLATLKIIFNARSIHLGKSSRKTFYKCAGWLAQYHPLTLITNLNWLVRPIIEKKVEGKESEGDEVVLVKPTADDEDECAKYDLRNGVAHGYWKDLLNILALYVNDNLGVLRDPAVVLNQRTPKKTKKAEDPKAKRHETRESRHKRAIHKFETDPVYRGLHIAITRLFVAQLKKDCATLQGEDEAAKRQITYCGKWAPSSRGFHDQHTFIVSSLAELMYPMPNIRQDLLTKDPSLAEDEAKMREVYLRHLRLEYQKSVGALRAHLDIVERHLTESTFSDIKYDRLPSLAMKMYANLFATKDPDGFGEYTEKVATGKAKISGATLLPSTFIKTARDSYVWSQPVRGKKGVKNKLVEEKVKKMQLAVLDGQWRTLVQRIRDSGTLESCIAVCDVSGSMMSPVFPDGTCPMDSSIGLSLLVAEVTKPPFGGTFISFSEVPQVHTVDPNKTLAEKVNQIMRASIGYSTNFVAVFEDLILPMAVKNKLKQEDMVKTVFAFSDMQFNQSQTGADRWQTSYQRIEKKYRQHGYEMPQLVFWNLAGGRAGYSGYAIRGDPVAPKPVTTDDVGTALVSGYSQGMLKVFLDNGSFKDDLEVQEDEVKAEDTADGAVKVSVAKKQMDPLSTVKKAISHRAYEMLKVVD